MVEAPKVTKLPGGVRWEGVVEGRFHYVHAHPRGPVGQALAYCRTCNRHDCEGCAKALAVLGYTLGDAHKPPPPMPPPKPGSPGTVAGPAAPSVTAPTPTAPRKGTRRTPKPAMEDTPTLDLTTTSAPKPTPAPAPPTPTPTPDGAPSGSFLDFLDTLGGAIIATRPTAR